MQIICRLNCLCIHRGTPPQLQIITQVFLGVRPIHQLPRQLAQEGLRGLTFGGSMQKLVYQSGESDRFWKDGETLNEFLDFSDGKNLFIMSLLALRWRLDHWSFLPVVELGYRAIFSWKVLNINWLWVSYDVYFFENNVF